MAENKTGQCIPQLRFPEFKNDGEWDVKEVKDICSIETGKSNTQDQVKDGSYPFFIRSEKPVRSNKYLYDCEAVITIGDGRIGQVFHYYNGKFDLHQRCYKISDFQGVDGRYFYYYFSAHFYERAMRMSAKATVDSVRLEMIAGMPIALPSFNEQKVIASCLSSLDAYISASKVKLEQLKTHKKGLMQKLFPAPGKTLPEYRFPEFKDDKEWEERSLGDLGDTYSGLTGKTSNDFGHGDAEYITYMNVFSNPIAKSYLNQPIETDQKQHQVHFGDVFFTVSSETPEEVGMTSIWLESKENVYLNSFCFGYRLRIKENFSPVFLSYFFRSPSFRKRMIVLAQGISRFNISKNRVMDLTIQFPSLYEQEKIAACLYSLDLTIDGDTQKVSSLENHKKGLIQQLIPHM